MIPGKNMRTHLLIISFLFLLSPSYSQVTSTPPKTQEKIHTSTGLKDNEEKKKDNIIRWNFGINVGVYFANKYPARFYSGIESNENKVSYVLNNKYWYQEIKNDLIIANPDISQSDTLFVIGYPTNINYNIVMTGGLFIRYNFSKHFGLCLDVNYTKLKAEDVVIFNIATYDLATNKFIMDIPVQGVEQRVHVDILLQKNFWMKSKIYFLAQGGLNLNYTSVSKNIIYFAPSEYSLVNIYDQNGYVPNTQLQENPVFQGGVGYGLALGGGIGVPLVDQFGIEAGGMLNYNNVNLTDYPDFKISYGFYVRFLFGNILPRPEPD
jgi:hypothetical protein